MCGSFEILDPRAYIQVLDRISSAVVSRIILLSDSS